MNRGIPKNIFMLSNYRIFHKQKHHLFSTKYISRYSHVWIQNERSLKLIIVITSHRSKAGSLGSQLTRRKYNEKDANEACQLNLYPMANHGNCKSQSRMWSSYTSYKLLMNFKPSHCVIWQIWLKIFPQNQLLVKCIWFVYKCKWFSNSKPYSKLEFWIASTSSTHCNAFNWPMDVGNSINIEHPSN